MKEYFSRSENMSEGELSYFVALNRNVRGKKVLSQVYWHVKGDIKAPMLVKRWKNGQSWCLGERTNRLRQREAKPIGRTRKMS